MGEIEEYCPEVKMLIGREGFLELFWASLGRDSERTQATYVTRHSSGQLSEACLGCVHPSGDLRYYESSATAEARAAGS